MAKNIEKKMILESAIHPVIQFYNFSIESLLEAKEELEQKLIDAKEFTELEAREMNWMLTNENSILKKANKTIKTSAEKEDEEYYFSLKEKYGEEAIKSFKEFTKNEGVAVKVNALIGLINLKYLENTYSVKFDKKARKIPSGYKIEFTGGISTNLMKYDLRTDFLSPISLGEEVEEDGFYLVSFPETD